MSFTVQPPYIGAAGGDILSLEGTFDTSATYSALLVGTDDSIGPLPSASSSLGASLAAGFSGALPLSSLSDLQFFPTNGRIVIGPHASGAESVGYSISGNAMVLAAPLLLPHAGGSIVRQVIAGLDTVPPFTAPLFSGVAGSAATVSPLSPTLLQVYSPALSAIDAIAYAFVRSLSFLPGTETAVAGPLQTTTSVRQFVVQLTKLTDGSIITSTNTLTLAAPFISSSVYDLRRYLSNYAVGARSVDQEGTLWGQ